MNKQFVFSHPQVNTTVIWNPLDPPPPSFGVERGIHFLCKWKQVNSPLPWAMAGELPHPYTTHMCTLYTVLPFKINSNPLSPSITRDDKIIMIMNCFECNKQYLKLYLGLNRKPMQTTKKGWDVAKPRGITNYPGWGIQNSLQFVKLVVGQPIQKTVTIINTRCNKCMDKHFRWFSRQILANAFDIMQMVKGNTT